MPWNILRRRFEPEPLHAPGTGEETPSAPEGDPESGSDPEGEAFGEPLTLLLAEGPSASVALTFQRRLLGAPQPLSGGLIRAEELVLEDLRQRVLEGEVCDSMVPRLPAVVPQVLRALRRRLTSAEDLARIISGDTALVGDIVRLANSAIYGVGRQIDSLSEAVVLLGDAGLRRLLMTASLRPIIDARAGLISAEGANLLWRKNQLAALAADFLAQRLAAPRFPAFLSGLLSQLGLIVLARALAQSGQPGFGAVSDPFLVEMDRTARRVSVRVCEHWGMPALVTATARVLAGEAAPDAPAELVDIALAADLLARFTLLEQCGYVDADESYDGFGLLGIPEDLAAACLEAIRRTDCTAL